MNATPYPGAVQQRQWDALFKSTINQASGLRSLIEKFLDHREGSLEIREYLPTELPSRTVASALHWKTTFKDLRSDGMYIPEIENTVVCQEFQSTHNPGMRLRFAMYEEAAKDNADHKIRNFQFQHILYYNGTTDRKYYGNLHGLLSRGYIDFLVIDLESIEWETLDNHCLHDSIVHLCLPSTDELDQFWKVLSQIDTDVSDAREASKLRAAVVVASLNKPGVAEIMLDEVEIDPNLRDNLKRLMPGVYQNLLDKERRERIIDLLEIRAMPSEYINFVEKAPSDWLDAKLEALREALKNDDDIAEIFNDGNSFQMK